MLQLRNCSFIFTLKIFLYSSHLSTQWLFLFIQYICLLLQAFNLQFHSLYLGRRGSDATFSSTQVSAKCERMLVVCWRSIMHPKQLHSAVCSQLREMLPSSQTNNSCLIPRLNILLFIAFLTALPWETLLHSVLHIFSNSAIDIL